MATLNACLILSLLTLATAPGTYDVTKTPFPQLAYATAEGGACDELVAAVSTHKAEKQNMQKEIASLNSLIASHKAEQEKQSIELAETAKLYRSMKDQHVDLLAKLSKLQNSKDDFMAANKESEEAVGQLHAKSEKLVEAMKLNIKDVPIDTFANKVKFASRVLEEAEKMMLSYVDELSRWGKAYDELIQKAEQSGKAESAIEEMEAKLKETVADKRNLQNTLMMEKNRLEELNAELKQKIMENQVYATERFEALQMQINLKDSQCDDRMTSLDTHYAEVATKLKKLEMNSYLVSYQSMMKLINSTVTCVHSFASYAIVGIPDSLWLKYEAYKAEMSLTLEKALLSMPALQTVINECNKATVKVSTWYSQKMHEKAMKFAHYMTRQFYFYSERLYKLADRLNSKMDVWLIPLYMVEPKLKMLIPPAFEDRVIFVAFLTFFLWAVAVATRMMFITLWKTICFLRSIIFFPFRKKKTVKKSSHSSRKKRASASAEKQQKPAINGDSPSQQSDKTKEDGFSPYIPSKGVHMFEDSYIPSKGVHMFEDPPKEADKSSNSTKKRKPRLNG